MCLQVKIGVISRKFMHAGEEITIDYGPFFAGVHFLAADDADFHFRFADYSRAGELAAEAISCEPSADIISASSSFLFRCLV